MGPGSLPPAPPAPARQAHATLRATFTASRAAGASIKIQEDTEMANEQQAKIERIERIEAQDLTPEQAEDATGGTGAFEIKDFSFGVENPTTIGSATGTVAVARI